MKSKYKNLYFVTIKTEAWKPEYFRAGGVIKANTPKQAHRFFVERTGYQLAATNLNIKQLNKETL